MFNDSWYQRPLNLLIVSAICPPVGLLLLWTRRGTGIGRKLFGSFVIAAISLGYIELLFGIRVEVNGSGTFPIVSLYRAETHYRRLEQSRAKKREEPVESISPFASPQEKAETKREPAEAPLEVVRRNLPSSKALSSVRPYWTDFRGPNRDGRYDETEILTHWPSEGLPRLWRQPIGGGYASFVMANSKAYTIEQRRDKEVVAAYDVKSGREIWTDSWVAQFRESMGGDGPRATPTWDSGRLYALGAAGELRCLDAETSKRLWSRNILSDNQATNLTWGMAASPLIVDDKVVVLPGGPAGKSVVAYDKITGKAAWKSLNDKQAYTSPMLVTLAGKRQILVVSAERALGLTVEDGTLLWDYPWVTAYGVNSAQPIILGEDRVFLSAGYDHGAVVAKIIGSDGRYEARTVWQNNQMKNKFNSSVLYQGYIYGLDEGILACVNADTGERKWKGGRYGYGQLLLAKGHLIVLTESGDLVLVEATPEGHHELSRFSAIDGKTWNHPAISGGYLLIRNTAEMACFRIGPA